MTKKAWEDHWEPVIGLEIHCELNTKSKLFSRAPNRFGDEPNCNISEVCTGQPGTLPVLNKEAVRKAVQLGCAINATVCTFSKFDRKSYFYPDSPRNFQITQFDEPIIRGGFITAEVGDQEMTFSVNRVHLEDDAGMLKHFPTFAGVDYNRAGVPLVEIVSEPCMHSSEEAAAYAMAVKAILQYIDASDCNMEEGSLRFDVNISVRPKGEKTLRNKVEIKNLNSFNYLVQAIESEIVSQVEAYSRGETIPQSTKRWDVEEQRTILMRSKEGAADYRYFPEPDLVPIILTQAYIEEVRASLPELPLQRERRYVKELGLAEATAFTLTYDKPTADYFEEALKETKNAKILSNWVLVEFAGRYKESGKTLANSGIPASHVGKLVHMIETNVINGKIAKSVADLMVLNPGKDPADIVKENPDFTPMNDSAAIEAIVTQVLKENPQSIVDFKSGRDKAFAFLVGQVMKQTRGKASPQLVNELLVSHIEKM